MKTKNEQQILNEVVVLRALRSTAPIRTWVKTQEAVLHVVAAIVALHTEPEIEILSEEQQHWLWENSEALASVNRGLEQAAQGRGRYLGSFAQYADLEIDDD